MSHIHDARNLSLSSLVSTLKLDSTTNSAKELRSKGNDLYVKQGKAVFPSPTSRASHRANAVALVRDSLANEYKATRKEAEQILANVFGHAPTLITGADARHLDELGHVAAGFMAKDKEMTAVEAFDAARKAETGTLSEGLRSEVSGLDDAPPPPPPPPPGPPGPPGLGVGGEPSWKSAMQVKLSDKYTEMVLAKDTLNPGGVNYHRGTVPGTTDDMSCDGESLATFSDQDKQVVGIAKEVLTEVRGKLPRGPFNNYGNLPESVLSQQSHPRTGEHSPAWWNEVVDAVAEKAVSQLKEKYPDVPEFKLSAACLARATEAVGGGVCSKLATLTTGVLTTKLPPGSEIAQVFHDYDHEFVVAKVPGSRWFVVDPWCHEPKVIPFVDCHFEPELVKNFITIKVTAQCPEHMPFGIDVDTGVDWDAIVSTAQRTVRSTNKDMSHVFGQVSNVKEGLDDVDGALGSVTQSQWGPPD